jgi:hypothetical protein
VAFYQALGLGYRFVIAVTNKRLEANKMPVDPDGKRPILCHPESPHLTDDRIFNWCSKNKSVCYRTQEPITDTVRAPKQAMALG